MGKSEIENKNQLQEWVSKLNANPSAISSIVEQALHDGLYSQWQSESKNHHFRLGSYYPSIIERCVRQQAYSYLVPQVPDAQSLAIFSEGKAIHELIASALRKSGLVSVEGEEIVVDLDFSGSKLHGRIDDLLLVRLSNEGDSLYVPLEVKSISSIPQQPKQTHYYQLSTYLLAKDLPFGVLLYWAKREGKIKAFTIQKEQVMYSVLRERVLEIHEALKTGELPQKEAALNHDYQQCERCTYVEKCNPFLIDSIPHHSKIAVFDIDSILLDASPRRKTILQEMGLPNSIKLTDIIDGEIKMKFWEMYNDPKYLHLDTINEFGKRRAFEQTELGRVIVGICPGRRDNATEITRGILANFGIPVSYLIAREPDNFDTETKFKTKWMLRLARNYDIVEYFDRDATAASLITKMLAEDKTESSTARS